IFMKKTLIFALAALLALSCLAFTACSGETNPGGANTPGGQTPEGNESTVDGLINCYIEFNGTSYTTTDSSMIKVDGSALTIIKPGTYDISGTLDNGQIIVEVTKADRVTLILNNFTGHNESSAVIWVKSADKVYLEVKTGTTNTLTDGSTYVFEGAETKPNACIYASDDLSIKGHGTLIVTGNYNNAIGSKNDLSINNCKLTVKAVNNALKGNDSVTIKGDAEVLIEGADDAIKADSLDEGKGYVTVTENAKVTVYCEDDALQSTQNITITTGATVTTYAKGNSVNCDGIMTIDDGCLIENTPEA
ncbi:MAG: carbohydrate-binding domain-containing protein, partial [Clostridia bacterium]|nr:carbohydrate-binding domain-containing protein [Clostridia bacterium]